MRHNVPTLGEGGDYNHKCRCGEQMLNTAVNVERSTAPPLLPNVCYTLPFICLKNIFEKVCIFKTMLYICKRNQIYIKYEIIYSSNRNKDARVQLTQRALLL